jgi:hypothetical protein
MQQGSGMPVFMGSAWQRGHCQVGYGLAGLFKSLQQLLHLWYRLEQNHWEKLL